MVVIAEPTMPADPQRVAVIDDIAVTRSGLVAELEAAGFSVAAFADVATCLASLAADPVDLVVCDLYLQGESGPPAFGALRQLTEAGPRVVVYSTWALDPDVLAALDAGVTAYVQKAATIDPLVAVLRRVVRLADRDGPIITPEIAAAVRRRERFGLTAAESEVLNYVGQHLTNAEIARVRSVSEDTIKTQLASIRGKLGASNRAGAVRKAHEFGLIGRWRRADTAS